VVNKCRAKGRQYSLKIGGPTNYRTRTNQTKPLRMCSSADTGATKGIRPFVRRGINRPIPTHDTEKSADQLASLTVYILLTILTTDLQKTILYHACFQNFTQKDLRKNKFKSIHEKHFVEQKNEAGN
jgi:hypothetical protein